MVDTPLPFPAHPDFAEIFVHRLESEGYIVCLFTLKKYPAAHHWHISLPNRSGVFEVTYDPASFRLWHSRRANREAPWIDALVLALPRILESVV